LVARVQVLPEELLIRLHEPQGSRNRRKDRNVVRIPWRKQLAKRKRELLLRENAELQQARPIRSETRTTLIATIARGRRWLNELVDDARATVENIAEREHCTARHVNMTISLAFLSPVLVTAAIEGRLPRGLGLTRLRDAPAEWSRQHSMLGLRC
jgi:hypothetical protein